MIDRKAIEAGIAEIKAYLIDETDQGRISFLGTHKRGQTTTLPDAFEIEGGIDVAKIANAFMMGAGIGPADEIAAVRAELGRVSDDVRSLRMDIAEIMMMIRPVPRSAEVFTDTARPRQRDGFKPLSGAPDNLRSDPPTER